MRTAQESGRVTPEELSRALGVSQITIRRDLRELTDQGLLQRVHGGALYSAPYQKEPAILQRMFLNRELKEAIGRTAAGLVEDGDSVFIGAGSTAGYVTRNLIKRSRLTVITNSISVGRELAVADNITVVVVGGILRATELSLIGHLTEQALKEVRVDKVIMGIEAISLEAGLTNDYLPDVMTDRSIIGMSPELILVADHTKFSKTTSAYVAPVSRVTTLVTDSGLDPVIVAKLEEMGIRVLLASPC